MVALKISFDTQQLSLTYVIIQLNILIIYYFVSDHVLMWEKQTKYYLEKYTAN